MHTHRTRLTLEALSDRIVPATGVFRNTLGQLVIEGTAGADSASVSVSGSDVAVNLNGTTTRFAAWRVRGLVFKGLSGDDLFRNNTALPSLAYGGNGNDTLIGGAATDNFFGGAGNDDLTGNGGNDILRGELGDDRLSGGDGSDQMYGGVGNDDCDGGQGIDRIYGEAGDDRLVGGLGSDWVLGGIGRNRTVRDSSDRFNDCQITEGLQQQDGLARVEGTIIAITGNDVTIRTVQGISVQVIITANTVLEKNGVHVPLSSFAVGDPAESKFDPGTRAAFKLESGEDPGDIGGGGQTGQARVEGVISGLGANSVSIRMQSGQVVTVLVTASTVLERNDQHVSLSAFQIGDRGEARYDGATGVASKVETVGV